MRKVFSLYSLAVMGMFLVSGASFAEQQEPKGSHELKVSRPTANPVLEGTVVV